jgi:hypothetical protein
MSSGIVRIEKPIDFFLACLFCSLLPGIGDAQQNVDRLYTSDIQLAQNSNGLGGGGFDGGALGGGFDGGALGGGFDGGALGGGFDGGALGSGGLGGIQSTGGITTFNRSFLIETLSGDELTLGEESISNFDFTLMEPIPEIPKPIFPNSGLIDWSVGPNAHCGAAAICSGYPASPITPPGIFPGQTGNITRPIRPIQIAIAESDSASAESGSASSRTNRYSFPTTVALQYEGGKVLCSGTVLSEKVVLTAAHCVCDNRPLHVFFGESLVLQRFDAPGIRTSLPVEPVPEFYDQAICNAYRNDPDQALSQHTDLAIVFLATAMPAQLLNLLHPFDQISGSNTPAKLGKLYAVGFGESDNRWWSGDKNFTELKYLSRLCTVDQAESYGCQEGTESIAANPPADTCYGDSGGGLYIQEFDGGPMILAGVTSRSLSNQESCGEGGIYTSLENPSISSWLKEYLQ